MMVDLARLDRAPYTVDLWVQTYGGDAGESMRTSGEITTGERKGGRRGSISYYPAGTAAEAERIQARLVEIAREVIRRAEEGTLIRL